MIAVRRAAALGALALLCIAATTGTRWTWRLPAGIAPPPVPADNPMSAAKVALGRRLFYDADLSIDGTMSYANCHEQRRGFADGNRTRPGVHGDPGRRNVPGLANLAWARSLTWGDPRLTTLEAQVAVPVLGDRPVEMGMKGAEAEIPRRFGRDPCYVRMFRAAFPASRGRIDMAHVARAIAAFERTLISYDAPYDRFRGGQANAIPAAARRGAERFGRDCAGCHAGADFSDGAFHALEPAVAADRGLGEISGRREDDGRFRTPGLRNVALGAPYFHDGRSATLADAIRRHGGAMAALPGDAAADLVALMESFTDTGFTADPRFAMPDRACGRRL